MKRLILIALLFPFNTYAFPGLSKNMDNCAIDYYSFCNELDKSVLNMCPPQLTDEMKKVCVVDQFKKTEIYRLCDIEIKEKCEMDDKTEFKLVYLCLVHPKNWNDFRKGCLDTLSKSFHSK